MRRTLLILLLLLGSAAGSGGLSAQLPMDPRTLRRGVAALRLRAMLGPGVTRRGTLPGFTVFPGLPPLQLPARRGRTFTLPLGQRVDLRAGVEWWASAPRGAVGIRLRF